MSSIRQLTNGRWQAQFRPVPGGKQVTRTHERKGVVKAWLDEQTAAIVTGTYVDTSTARQTLRTFYETWAPRQVWEASTTRAMDAAVLSTPFIDEPLRAVTRARVEAWIKAMQVQPRGPVAEPTGRGLAPSTIRTRLQNVRTVLRAAVADQALVRDPTVGVRIPRQRRREAAMSIPTSAEVRAWLSGTDESWRALLALAAFAGLRLGEATALRVGDIGFPTRSIAVHRQVQRGSDGHLEVRLPKHGSERNVEAADGLLSILSEHIALRGLQGHPDAWLFPGESDLPAHPNTAGHAWRKGRALSGIRAELVLHDLRHYYASGLIEARCSVATVQHALGHASPSITLNTYTHLWPTAEDHTRRASGELMRTALGAPADSLRTRQA